MNFILDADIRRFFNEVSQDWLVRLVQHRIGDPRIVRLIQKWLKAGVLEDGEKIVILLCGGDKRTQDWDIARAIQLAREL